MNFYPPVHPESTTGTSEPVPPAETRVLDPREQAYDTIERLLSEHRGRLERAAYQLTNDVHRAQDLAGEAVVRSLGSKSVQEGTVMPCISGLHKILTTTYIDRLRRNSHELGTVSLDEMREETGFDVPDETNGVKREVERLAAAEQVEALLRHLPKKMQEVIRLRYIEDLTPKEIAQRMRIPEGTVKSCCNRGMKQLQFMVQNTQAAG